MQRRHVCLVLILGLIAASNADGDEKKWITLLGDDGLDAWRTKPEDWLTVADACLNEKNPRRLQVAKAGKGVYLNGEKGRARNLVSKQAFQDVELHVEFMVSKGSNSGVKLNGTYEIQIYDSYGKPVEKLTGSDCGGVYPRAEYNPRYRTIDKGVPPKVNATKAPGEWQTLDIVFKAPRFDDSGKKIASATFVKVVLNGTVIHENVEAKWPTGAVWNKTKEKPRGPILLQADHGPVAFRNVKVRQ